MRITPSSKNRLCIYFFYDKQGIVDEYVFVMLREMQKYVTTIELVSNGALQPSSKQALLEMGVSVMERPNEGFDVWAYRHGLMAYGWQKLSQYDEVILMNFTIVGPVGSFADMFATMDEKDLDFWGITIHYGENYDPWNKLEGGCIPRHIQSHFIAVRRNMLGSKDFQAYWEDMCPITNYTDAIAYHEAIFTGHFEKLGFRWDAYVQADDLEPLVSYPLMFLPHIMLEQKVCPIIKRKSFLLTMNDIGGNGCGDLNWQLLDSLQRLNFDTRPILAHVIRSGERYLVIARIEDMSVASLFDDYLQGVVEYADVHIKASAKQVFRHYEEMEKPGVAVKLYEDTPSFRECMEDKPSQYPWVCFLGFCDPWARGEKDRSLPHMEHYRLILESLLASREHVLNYLASDMIPYYYGLLMPPTPIHAGYTYSTVGMWLWKQQGGQSPAPRCRH